MSNSTERKFEILIKNLYRAISWIFSIIFRKLIVSLLNTSDFSTGRPNKHGNSVTNSISSLTWISIVIPNFESHNIIMSARVYFIKTVNGCKDKLWKDGQVYSVCILHFLFVLLSTTVCRQNINKQIVNIADENHTDYSFLSRYHYNKSKNYLKRRYRIRHWIPMFIGTPCISLIIYVIDPVSINLLILCISMIILPNPYIYRFCVNKHSNPLFINDNPT